MTDVIGNHRILSVRWLAILSALSALEKITTDPMARDIHKYLENIKLPYSLATISTALTHMKQSGYVEGSARAPTPGNSGARSTFRISGKGKEALNDSFRLITRLKHMSGL